MPKKIDPALRDRAVRLVREHRSEYPSLTAASAAVARQVGVGHESVRRWVLQADIDDGARDGVTSVEHAETKRLKAENKRLREDVAILKAPDVHSEHLVSDRIRFRPTQELCIVPQLHQPDECPAVANGRLGKLERYVEVGALRSKDIHTLRTNLIFSPARRETRRPAVPPPGDPGCASARRCWPRHAIDRLGSGNQLLTQLLLEFLTEPSS
jgi:transposase